MMVAICVALHNIVFSQKSSIEYKKDISRLIKVLFERIICLFEFNFTEKPTKMTTIIIEIMKNSILQGNIIDTFSLIYGKIIPFFRYRN